MEVRAAYGWYGKVPCVGDFVRAGLSPDFVRGWDRWMQALLVAGHEALGKRWEACYMGAPIWRFALSPGLCGAHAVAGVVMPSVDRVGRRFPLCLAAQMESSAWGAYRAAALAFDALEETALAMLEDGANLEGLEEMLSALPTPNPTEPVASDGPLPTIVTTAAPEHGFAALGASDPAALWIAQVEGANRVMLTSTLPEGPEAARTLFDLAAPTWRIAS